MYYNLFKNIFCFAIMHGEIRAIDLTSKYSENNRNIEYIIENEGKLSNSPEFYMGKISYEHLENMFIKVPRYLINEEMLNTFLEYFDELVTTFETHGDLKCDFFKNYREYIITKSKSMKTLENSFSLVNKEGVKLFLCYDHKREIAYCISNFNLSFLPNYRDVDSIIDKHGYINLYHKDDKISACFYKLLKKDIISIEEYTRVIKELLFAGLVIAQGGLEL